MHEHKKLCDTVLRICMLSFAVAAIIIATVAHMHIFGNIFHHHRFALYVG